MTKYTKVNARMFVKHGGEYKYVKVPIHGMSDNCGMLEIEPDNLPPELDTLFPQDIYLVYQDAENDNDFFDRDKPGNVLVLEGFRVIYKEPLVTAIAISKITGEIHTPKPEFEFICSNVRWADWMTED